MNISLKNPPDILLPWLNYKKFITKKLEKITDLVHMKIHSEQWENKNAWDKNILKIPDQKVLHREILMYSNTNPCWYARTILPVTTFNNHQNIFSHLKTSLLGKILFDEQYQITRKTFKYYEINQHDSEYSWIRAIFPEITMPLWMRLSEFSIKQQDSFFLAEIFLPDLVSIIIKHEKMIGNL